MRIKTMLMVAAVAVGGLGLVSAAKADHFHHGHGCYGPGPSPYYSQRVTVYQYGPAVPPPLFAAPAPPIYGPPVPPPPGFIGPRPYVGVHAGFGGPHLHFHYSRYGY